MKQILLTIGCIIFMTQLSSAQLIISKMLGKDGKEYGLGAGIFTYLDFPLASGNKSIIIELVEFAYFPEKGGGYFSAPSGKGYFSFKAGFRNYFSETGTGFYIQPSAGCAMVSIVGPDEPKSDEAFGFSGSMEGGYSIALAGCQIKK